MESLSDIDENPAIPGKLPAFAKNDDLNDRKIGGEYWVHFIAQQTKRPG